MQALLIYSAALAAVCLTCTATSLHAQGSSVSTESAAYRTYAWGRTLDHGSLEHATIERRGKALRIKGETLAAHERKPLRLTYAVTTDMQGASEHLALVQEYDGQVRRLLLARVPEGWSVDGRVVPELAECTDIDLGLSPSTNALPIARMVSAGLEQANVRAAWVQFPSLVVTPATQRYTHAGPGAWRYESLTSGFGAELHVDDWHFPVVYGNVWTQVAMEHRDAPEWKDDFAAALTADAPSPALGGRAADFDWLVGGWDATVRDIAENGTVRTSTGEWWFSWILDGHAMQDVWISPPRRERGKAASGAQARERYGTTIRRFDRVGGIWRVIWIDPATGAENELSGTRRGDAITLLGMADGRPIKWQFVDIRPDRFTWQGYRLESDGVTWRLEAEFMLQRRGAATGGRN